MLTIGQKLDRYLAKRVSPDLIREPLVRALWFRRWEKQNQQIVFECFSNPSDWGDLSDAASREVEWARASRRKILSHMWAMRMPAIVERESSEAA